MLARFAAARRRKYEAWVSYWNGATVRGGGRGRAGHRGTPTSTCPCPGGTTADYASGFHSDEARAAPNFNSTT